MKSKFPFSSSAIFSTLLLCGCYDSETAFTKNTAAIISLDKPNEIIADSATVQKISIEVPGLRAQQTLAVDITTDWGTWINKSQTTKLTAQNIDNNAFKAETYLLPARTIQPFTITISANGQEWKQTFQSIPRYPTRIELVPDSLALKKKIGNYSRIKLYATSDIGFPSYGLRFLLTANQYVSFIPSQLDYGSGPNRITSTRATIINNLQLGDSLIISTSVANASVQPKIRPARIYLRR